MPLPPNLDENKLSEAALAILGLTAFNSHHITRVWKGMDWDLLGLLFQKGWIEDPVGKSKSVVLTEMGERLAPELLRRHFARESPIVAILSRRNNIRRRESQSDD